MVELLKERLKTLENDKKVCQSVYEQAYVTVRQSSNDMLLIEGAIREVKRLIAEQEKE